MLRKTFRKATSLTRIVAVTLSGCCALATFSPARAQEELKIGIIAALSGGGTAWGLSLQRGVQIALDEVNQQGGLKVAGKTYTLKSVAYDDQYNAAQARTAAERLVNQEKVKIIFGPVGSPGALGSLPVTQPAKVLQFVDGYAPAILKNEWKGAYIFRVGNSNREFAEPIVKWIKQTMPEIKKVGMIVPNDATGQAAVPILAEAYKKHGYEVWTEYYERGSKEFTPLLVRMMSQNVDLFELNSNAPGEAGLLVKQARQVGFKGTILQSGGAGIEEAIEIAGPLAEGFLKYDVIDSSLPQVKAFLDVYNKKYSGIMGGLAPVYYNATHIVLEAIRRADSLDTSKIRDEIEKLGGYEAPIFGKVIWTGKDDYGVDHQLFHAFLIKEVKDGKGIVKTIVTSQ
ncbi:ABC transporter substrate-binding protein [Pollutimonas bauzanensis]|uniref:Branched-chain amino acid transport system substrate-binding protein n=1 Tax=Pollutimonas bauzanensis TaxID=658167 RepID=A0A1M5R1C8_9BURK|nr:ABC transporter substrate-binding protein [Pollutimonas bauzanensis]SHH20185.1 branched-chain amino acid transport system substrate-binding protein [Pollutimonas bauzanensis]